MLGFQIQLGEKVKLTHAQAEEVEYNYLTSCVLFMCFEFLGITIEHQHHNQEKTKMLLGLSRMNPLLLLTPLF